MTTKDFNDVIDKEISRCKDILVTKATEYATEDRLHNFKCAAGMMGCSPQEALCGMMAKHTISIYDMCRSGQLYSIDQWNEKITDHINYLLLLKAIICDGYGVESDATTHLDDNRDMDIKVRAKEMFNDGMLIHKIAQKLDVPFETVIDWLREGTNPGDLILQF